MASESRSTQAAARQLGISPKRLYRWQQQQAAAELGRDPEVRALRAERERVQRERDISKKKPWPVACYKRRLSRETP